MSEEFQANLGNPYVNPASDQLKLLFLYIEKELEFQRRCDKEDGIDVDAPGYTPHSSVMERVLGFEKYRRAYTESIYLDLLVRQGYTRNPSLTEELDRNQRQAHNTALTYLLGFKRLGKVLDLDPLYTGKEVSEESISGMKSDHSEARKEMTDFFLNLVSELSSYNLRAIENEAVRNQIKSVQRQIDKDDSDFRVKNGGLKEYHGDIEFE